MTSDIPVLLCDGEIGLRVPERADAVFYWKMRNDLRVAEQLISYSRGVPLYKIEKWLDGLRDTDDPLIFTAVRSTPDDSVPIGFVKAYKFDKVAQTCWAGLSLFDLDTLGNGYGTKILGLLLSYLDQWLNMRKISVEVLDDNDRAISLYKKFGFVQEGKMRDQYFIKGRLRDIYIMSRFSSTNV